MKINQKFNNLSVQAMRSRMRLVTVLALCLIIGIVAAVAQTTGSSSAFDYTSSITAANTDFTTVLSTDGPPLIGVMLLALGFGFVWRLIKKAIHSV
jgi:hypothetical protein